jgi:hypothetical protein
MSTTSRVNTGTPLFLILASISALRSSQGFLTIPGAGASLAVACIEASLAVACVEESLAVPCAEAALAIASSAIATMSRIMLVSLFCGVPKDTVRKLYSTKEKGAVTAPTVQLFRF